MFTYTDAMKYIEDSARFGMVPGLENIKELLENIGNPQNQLRFVHVAGTNGKGSVCTYISSVLKEGGYKVGRYISPAVFHYRERILTDGNRISEESFVRHIEQIIRAVEKMTGEGKPNPTVFEIETATAFLEFLEQKCDVMVLEVGLGGRLDATNVIETADCGVISSVSMDHMGILGSTLEEIAREKGGIIKEGMEVVSYQQESSVEKVLKEICKEKKVPLTFADFKEIGEINYSLEKTSFTYSLFNEKMNLETQMLGEHQIRNAVVAVEAAMALKRKGYSLSKETILNGIKKAVWEGRFSIIHTNPYVIADGAHNEEAAISLSQSVKLYFGDRRMIRIIGVFADKEYGKILKNSVKEDDYIYAVRPDSERALDSAELAKTAEQYCKNVTDAKSLKQGLELGLMQAEQDDVIVIYGSLSILKEAYEYFGKKCFPYKRKDDTICVSYDNKVYTE